MLTLTNMIRGANGLLNFVKRTDYENDREMYRNISILKGGMSDIHSTYPTIEALAVHCHESPKNKLFIYDWISSE